MTIDPARRLANSLGLAELGNEPALIDPERFTEHGVEMHGELWAMMLDAKRTFDELVEHLAPDERTRAAREPFGLVKDAPFPFGLRVKFPNGGG